MPEPIALVIGGIALYKYLKRGTAPPTPQAVATRPAAATAQGQVIAPMPPGALATNTSVVNAGVATLATPGDAVAVPSDLVAALDTNTALMFRAYAALNPADFQAFLNRYADRLVLRNDLYVEALTDPPPGGYQLTPAMIAGLGTASYKVAQALNGVYVGRSVDLFGVSASVAGQIPGVNRDLVSGLQAAAMGYRVITGIADVMTIASAANVSVINLTELTALSGTIGGVSAYPGLAALPFAGVLMAVGLVVDIGFTIIGDKPDLQKAVDVALDVASLAVLFIPVIGIVIAIVIQLVKFIIDLFGEELFGGGMSREQREMLEAARYGERLNPMFPEVASAYTPRELWRTLVQWGSGYCGGVHVVAMSINLILRAGDTFVVGGRPWTVPPELDGLTFGFGDNEQPGGCYWIRAMPGPLPSITNDEQAWMLGALAPVNGVLAGAQVGIAEWRQVQFEDPAQKLVMARAAPMREFLVRHRLSLDQIDQIAAEYRAQPHLEALASAFGWPTWQDLFASTVSDEWRAYTWSTTTGSLSGFAASFGHPTMYAFRASALAPFENAWAEVNQARQWAAAEAAALQSIGEQAAAMAWAQSMSAP